MADQPTDRWLKFVTLTTTILAVCAAISTLRGGSNSTKVQLSTVAAANKWSYFQSKSIKQHSCETERDLLRYYVIQAKAPEERKYLTDKLASVDADILRYDGEKADITKDAIKLEEQQKFFMDHSQSLGMAAMLLQIAIMLSAISALLKKPHTWYLGLASGVVGLFFMIKGLYL